MWLARSGVSGVDSDDMGHTFLWLSSIASTRKVNLAVISFQFLMVGIARTMTRLVGGTLISCSTT